LNEFIQENKNVSIFLSPANKTGPDGILLLNCKKVDNNDKEYIMILIGVKYSMKTISKARHQKNELTTKLENLFQPRKQNKSKNSKKPKEQNIGQVFKTNLLERFKQKVHLVRFLIEFDISNKTSYTTYSQETDTLTCFISASGFLKMLDLLPSFSKFKSCLNEILTLNTDNEKDKAKQENSTDIASSLLEHGAKAGLQTNNAVEAEDDVYEDEDEDTDIDLDSNDEINMDNNDTDLDNDIDLEGVSNL